jgi:glyoxylase-like metal-dependent hydrolase (beta-lactamase superfamily II)
MQLGRWRVHAIQAGGMWLDGGAMFGVVPKPLWERKTQPDDRNRIPMGMRCLLVEHEAGPVLIDTGAGNKEDAKFRDIFAIENEEAPGPTALEDGLRAAANLEPHDIAFVLNTHLHFDHAGGNTRLTPDGTVVPSFPSARYVVQRGEYAFATHPNERTAGSYFPRNYVPLHEAGLYELVDGETEILPGIRLLPTPGHVPFHQSVLLESDGQRALFVADLIPTAAHLPLPWIMGYDVEPLVTLETKRRILRTSAEEDWLLVFEHDPRVAWGTVSAEGKHYRLVPRPDGQADASCVP